MKATIVAEIGSNWEPLCSTLLGLSNQKLQYQLEFHVF
ncbi:uncharacterized protein METZ01_LOCUS222758, partial [marine metagenome]